MAEIIWTSASKVKSWFACARRAWLEKFVETEAMRDGKERHYLVESHYLQKPPLQKVKPESVAAVETAIARGLLPPHDQVVSCEGSDLPKEHAIEAYGKTLFKVQIGFGDRPWGLRGAADLVVINHDDADTLWLIDWKGRTQDDGEIQGSCYALAYSAMFPGFKRYVFQQRSLTLSWPHDTYEFLADDMPKVAGFVEKLVYAMTDDEEHAPRENRWCSSCGVNGDCPVYLQMVSVPVVESLPAVKTFNLPLDFGPLLALKERAANYEKIAEALKDRCQEELLKILAHGPVKENGHTYSKGSGTSGYKPKEGRLSEIIQTLEACALPVQDFFVLDTPRVRAALDVAMKKTVINSKQDQIKAVIKDCFEPSTYPKIIRKAG